MLLERWKIITKVCIVCKKEFECRSTARRTQRCPICDDAEMKRRKNVRRETNKHLRLMSKPKNCQKCGKRDNYLFAHHVQPVSCGGSPDLDNVVYLCDYCHEIAHSVGWLANARGK